jgi:hypothetical protein
MVHLCYYINYGYLTLIALLIEPDSGGLLIPNTAILTTNYNPSIKAIISTIVLTFIGAASDLNSKETIANGSSSITIGRTSSLTEDIVPIEIEIGLSIIPLPTIFIGDSAIDSIDRK